MLCERCKSKEATTKTRWGLIQDICDDCSVEEVRRFNEGNEKTPTGVDCPQCGRPYLVSATKTDSCGFCDYAVSYWG